MAKSKQPPPSHRYRFGRESTVGSRSLLGRRPLVGEQLESRLMMTHSPAIAPSNGKATSQEDASYICDACGEEIVIPLDLSEGSIQTYVEDLPVCCRANTIHVQIDNDGEAQVWAEPGQDYD